MKTNISIAILVLTFLAAPLSAHHSFSAEYDINKSVTFKGRITKIEWVNPHSWIFVDAVGDDGKVVHWSVEFGSVNALLRQGIRKTDIPIGAEVVVQGYLSKNGKAVVNGTSVKSPDGRNFYTSSNAPE